MITQMQHPNTIRKVCRRNYIETPINMNYDHYKIVKPKCPTVR